MDITRLTRQSHRKPHPNLSVVGPLEMAGGRAHELCGPARRRLALWVARATQGPVLWIRPAWHPDRLHMSGVLDEISPGRLIAVDAGRAEDVLWSTEEALRSGAVPLVVVDLPEPPGLTSVRRLHLAAEAGAEVADTAPLALLLTPGDGGAAGVESRWALTPSHGTEQTEWRLERRRARSAPPKSWSVARQRNGALGITTPDALPELA